MNIGVYIETGGIDTLTAKDIKRDGIKTVTGKSEWSTSSIDRMLSNEKYVGQVLMGRPTCRIS